MPCPAYFAAQHKLAMSLGHVLSGCKRARVPDHVLMLCRPADAQVVENILSVLQDTMPCANITLAVLRAHSNLYEITIPVRSGNVSLQHMMALQQYSPARIADVHVTVVDAALCLVLSVCDETRPVVSSHIDVIRISKRVRRDH
jgi:hypothetical protein